MQAGNPVGRNRPVGPTAVSANKAPVGRDSVPAILSVLLRNLIPTLVLFLLLTSCGMFTGTPHANRPAVGAASMPYAAGELEAALTAELARLGKPYKMPASAPSGTANAAFDLTAVVVESGGQATGVQLTWTERLLGDYNQDGQVNAGDLAPLGINWQQAVQYDAASAHGGIAYWPAGDPGDGAVGAANWRRARIDGNADGVLDVKDVTAVAVHWQERMSGCRVYRKGPGESSFTMLPGPGDDTALTLSRPTVVPTAPVRYSFTDTPPLAGQYEYYVAAFAPVADGASGGEGPVSGTVAVNFTGGGYLDTTPPVWQGSPGITAATAGLDGTVTVTWGTAVDNAVPPAPASPPVSYTVYYSTQTPIDYENAAYFHDVTSPWVSPELLSGQVYYFAVRARDSASPPNEDTNTAEAIAVASGGPIYLDYFLPEWPEYNDDKRLVGITEVAAEDGRLVIRHAKAMDIHSPPVHYDLWYASAREVSTMTDTIGNPDPLAHVIHDIPPEFTLEWENRHPVFLAVVAHDSAAAVNEQIAHRANDVMVAPGRAEKIPIDMNFPGSNMPDFSSFNYDNTASITTKKIYICYMPYSRIGLEPKIAKDLWFLDLDALTGQWQAECIYTAKWNTLEAWDKVAISISPSGEIWAFCREFDGVDDQHPGNYYGRFFIRHKNGAWDQWSPPGVPTTWEEQFDHNSNPAFFEFPDSDTTPDRCKLIYKWWNANTQAWVREEVCDPGATDGITFLRPDGVLQLVSPMDGAPLGDESPRYFRVNERTLDGVWTQVLSGVGYVAGEDHSNRVETWDQQWAWSLTGHVNEVSGVLVYGIGAGYQFLPAPEYIPNVGESYRAWPADDGYHILPYGVYMAGKMRCQSLVNLNYCKTAPYRPENVGGGYFDPISNYYSGTVMEFNLTLRRWQFYLFRCPADETLY